MSAVEIVADFSFGLGFGKSGAEKMSWDYRIVFFPYEEGSDEGEFVLREVYYDEEGEVTWYADDNVELVAHDFWEFAEDFDVMADAFNKPVLVVTEDGLVEDDSEEEESEDE